jgi:putative addiction module component (TIGR02574 family)
MSKQLEEITQAAMQLDLEERALLAGALLRSVDPPSESEIERLWLDEAERRLQAYREGKVKGIPAEQVFNRVIAEIS